MISFSLSQQVSSRKAHYFRSRFVSAQSLKLCSLKQILLKTVPLFAMLLVAMSLLLTKPAFAEACTYNEAIIAFKQGNEIRGMALLKMAVNDGDTRAQHLLALKQQNKAATMLVMDDTPAQ